MTKSSHTLYYDNDVTFYSTISCTGENGAFMQELEVMVQGSPTYVSKLQFSQGLGMEATEVVLYQGESYATVKDALLAAGYAKHTPS